MPAAEEPRAGTRESGAIAAYRAAVQAIDTSHDHLDPRLAVPLYGLGRALADAGRHQEAAAVLAQAVFVRRTSFGLYDAAQLEFYDALMESLFAIGRDDDVAARQLARVAIVERVSGPQSPELLDTLAEAAAWLRRAGHAAEERALHERRLEILRAGSATSDPRVVSVLRDVARSYGAAHDPDIHGVLTLTQALELAEQLPGGETGTRAEILAELGDFYLIFRSYPSASHYYDRARALLAGDDQAFAAAFADPRPLWIPAPEIGKGTARDPDFADALVSLRVDERGSVDAVEIVEIAPDTAAARAAADRSLRRARFRPRFTSAGAIAATGVRYRHRFRYLEGAGGDEG